jgi:hypothetical protein
MAERMAAKGEPGWNASSVWRAEAVERLLEEYDAKTWLEPLVREALDACSEWPCYARGSARQRFTRAWGLRAHLRLERALRDHGGKVAATLVAEWIEREGPPHSIGKILGYLESYDFAKRWVPTVRRRRPAPAQ